MTSGVGELELDEQLAAAAIATTPRTALNNVTEPKCLKVMFFMRLCAIGGPPTILYRPDSSIFGEQRSATAQVFPSFLRALSVRNWLHRKKTQWASGLGDISCSSESAGVGWRRCFAR